MRISDWSSDVCSSDLKPPPAVAGGGAELPRSGGRSSAGTGLDRRPGPQQVAAQDLADVLVLVAASLQAGDEVRDVGHSAQLVGKLAAHDVDVRADADAADAYKPNRVDNMIDTPVGHSMPPRG